MGYCFKCFKSFDYTMEICPFCGEEHHAEPLGVMDLMPGTVLVGKYIVGHRIGSGGFGIVYRGFDKELERIVAIKECFIREDNYRDAGKLDVEVLQGKKKEFDFRKERFLDEAKSMARLGNHPSFVNVYDHFEANHTAYIIMELLDGENLGKYIKREGNVDVEFAIRIANEVGNALSSLHELNIIHRDVAPDNIQLKTDGTIKLMDLGSAIIPGAHNQGIDLIKKTGYTPVEQYNEEETYGPYVDVYALGATIYRLLTGIVPPESTNRLTKDELKNPPKELNIPVNVTNSIMNAMAVDKEYRYQSISAFLKDLNGDRKVLTVNQIKRNRKRRRSGGVLLVTCLLFCIGLLLWGQYKQKRDRVELAPAEITMWYIEDGNIFEEQALKAIIKEFEKEYPRITVNLKGFSREDYQSKLEAASVNGNMPNLFECTGVSISNLSLASNIRNVYSSEQAKECLFIDDNRDTLISAGRIPLGIVLPAMIIINEGNVSIDYTEGIVTSMEQLGTGVAYTVDTEYNKLVDSVATKIVNGTILGTEAFYAKDNTCALCLTTTMEVRDKLQILANRGIYSTDVSIAYLGGNEINAAYTYEWSIGKGSKAENAAAERLMSYMLGVSYQSIMIGQATSAIPVNKECLEAYTGKADIYKPIRQIYKSISVRQ